MMSKFSPLLLTLSLLQYCVTAQYSSLWSGNFSAHGSIPSAASSPAVTASASLGQSGNQVTDCKPCQIMVGWESISRVYWYSSSIGITLDTVSLIVTKYNNTAVTRSSTVYGDIDTVNVSSVAEAQSIATSLGQGGGDNDYDLVVGVILSNATKGNVDAPAYPTPYLAIDGFQYVSLSTQIDGCLLGKRGSPYTCSCPMESIGIDWVYYGEPNPGPQVPSVALTSTYYETLDFGPYNNLVGEMDNDFGLLNTQSFLNFLSSASVFKTYPELSSCAVFSGFNGPPQVLIPAVALTTTVATTVTGLVTYSPLTPQPGSPINPTPIAPQTPSTPQSASPLDPAPIAPQTAGNVPTVQTGQAAPGKLPIFTPAAPASSYPEAVPSSPNSFAGHGDSADGASPAKAGQQPPIEGLSPVLTFGGSKYTADESSNIVLSSQTIIPGSPAATIANTPISIAPGGLAAVVGTSTQLLVSFPSPAVLTFGGSAYTADASSNIIFAGSTLRAGGTPIVVSGTTVSLAPGGAAAVIGTLTQVLGGLTPTQESSNTVTEAPHPAPAVPVLTFEGSVYTANAASQFVVAGQTVTPGGVIEISGTPISVAPGASVAVIGSSTQSLVGPAITPHPILTFAGSTYTAGTSSEFLINGQTLTKGGTINVDGTQLSFGQAGTYVVIGTSTQQLHTPSITAIAEPILTFDGSVYTAGPSSDFVIDGQTLTRGGAIDVDGTRLSYGQGGTEVVIGTSTQELGTTTITVAEVPAINFDGSTYYADSASNFVIDGQTLTRVSGTDVVIGTSTEAVGLGGYIMSGLGGGPSSTLPVEFTGKAGRRIPAIGMLYLIAIGLTLYVVA